MNNNFIRRRQRVRKALKDKSNGRPRLSIFKSNKHIYAQIIDDLKGVTLASASTHEEKFKSIKRIDAAQEIGKLIANKAKGINVTSVVFDRGGYLYHGIVKAIADSARSEGLII